MAIDTGTANRERAKRVLAALPPWPTAALPALHAAGVPLRADRDTGRVRVAGTRIPIDTVVYAYRDGWTADDIVRNYPALSRQDVDAVVSYYLRHGEAVDAYLRAWEAHEYAVRSAVEADPVQQAFRRTLTERRELAAE